MIRLILSKPTANERTPDRHRYRVVGVPIDADAPIQPLAPFTTTAADEPPAPRLADLTCERPRRASGLLAERMRRIELRPADDGISLRFDSLPDVAINAAADRVTIAPGRVDRAALDELILGPALLIPLAARGCWPLHASAVKTAGGITLIAGESGAGKSTLAARSAEDHGDKALRAADDVVHVLHRAGDILAHPCYPQLKLPAAAQCSLQPAPLRRVLILEPVSPSARLVATRLQRTAGLIAIVHHSIATQLFPSALLQAHFAACCAIAEQVPILRVHYPHSQRALRRLSKHVAEDTQPSPGR